MKTNKKAILGFAMSMIFSLAIMQGISQKNVQQQRSLQQVSLGSAYAAGQAESQSWQNVWNQTTEISNIVLEWGIPIALGATIAPEAVVSKAGAATAWIVTGAAAL
jgi:hypothetical protein